MKVRPLDLGNIRAEVPVIQGGMGIGISLSGLSGAVAKEGGIGIISAAQIGFREPDFDKDPLKANLRAIEKEYTKARKIAPDGVIGFNIMTAMNHYGEYVKAAVHAGADIIISGAGLPTELPKLAREAIGEMEEGQAKEVKLAPIVSTDKSAKVILKYWDKKYTCIPDLLVIEGPKAGGHLGFTEEQIKTFGDSRYDAEIKEILKTVHTYEEKYCRTIPVALAGGINTKEQAEHAFSIGIDAIQVSTRFVATKECDADIRFKEAYIKAREEDIVIVKSPVGMPGRAINNAFATRAAKGEKIPHSPCHRCLRKCNPAETPYCITDALIHAAKGEIEDALLFCGAYAHQSHKIETVKEVIDSLLPERV